MNSMQGRLANLGDKYSLAMFVLAVIGFSIVMFRIYMERNRTVNGKAAHVDR